MICEDLNYNEVCDMAAVEPFGFIDLRKVYVTHSLPTNIDGEDVAYNGIEDPSAILGKPSDIFEAYRMRDAVLKSASATPKEGETTE